MAIAPAIIAGGALVGSSIGGGLLSAHGKKKEQKRNINWQREQLQNSIRWRAEDAKRAGIHPLYAMGANIQSPTPLEVGGDDLGNAVTDMGQGLAQLTNRYQMPQEKAMQVANVRVLESEAKKNDAMAQFYSSQAVNPQTSSAPAASFSTDPAGNIQPPGLALPGQVTFKAPDVMSTNPADISATAGRNPGYMKIDIDPKMPMVVPYTQEGLGESLENLGPLREPGNAMKNANQYGDLRYQWLKDYYGLMFLGQPPSRDWNKVPKPQGLMHAPPNLDLSYSGISQGTKDAVNRALKQGRDTIRRYKNKPFKYDRR